MAVAVSKQFEPRHIGDASSVVRAVAYCNRPSEFIRPTKNKGQKIHMRITTHDQRLQKNAKARRPYISLIAATKPDVLLPEAVLRGTTLQ